MAKIRELLAVLGCTIRVTKSDGLTVYKPTKKLQSKRSRPTNVWRTDLQPSSYDAWIEPDYLISDSIGKLDRPTLIDFLSAPRNAPSMTLIMVATAVSISNVLGNYGDSYLQLEQASIVLAFWNAGADYLASTPPYANNDPTKQVSPNIRTGAVDDAVVHLYAAAYTASATWLAWRTSPLCPSLLTQIDLIACPLAFCTFVFSLVCPVLTLVHHSFQNIPGPLRRLVGIARLDNITPNSEESLPLLTPTELLRARSLLAIGFIGCVFAPEVGTLALRGQEWWHRVGILHPSQMVLESSTALFAVYSTQASMVAHRAGKAGVAPFQDICPAFAGVCFVLTIFPCACALYWLGKDVSFFGFYTE